MKIMLNIVHDNYPEQAGLYHNIGVCHFNMGNYDHALGYFQKSLKIRLELFGKDHPEVAGSYYYISQILRETGDFSEALDYSLRLLEIRIKTLGKEHHLVAGSYNNTGNIFLKIGDYEKALEYFQMAYSVIIKSIGVNRPDVGVSHISLGSAYENLGKFDLALKHYNEALEILIKTRGNNHPIIASAYHNIGDVYMNKNNNLALEYYQKSVDVLRGNFGHFHPDLATSLKSMGDISGFQGSFSQALTYYQKGLSSLVEGFDNSDIYSNPHLKRVNSKTRLLIQLYTKSSVAEKFYNQTKKIKNLRLSFETSLLAADLIDSMRNDNLSIDAKRDLAENSTEVYETCIRTAKKLYELTNDENYLKEAFNLSERSKSFLLLQALQESEAKQFSAIPDSLLEKERDLKIDISFYEKQLFEAEQYKDTAKILMYQNYLFDRKRNYEALISAFEKQYPDYYDLKYSVRTASVGDIRQKLSDENSAFVEYFWGDSAVYAFTITKQSFDLQVMADPNRLREKIEAFQQSLSLPPGSKGASTAFDSFATASYTLYRELLSPLFKEKRLPAQLFIIPDGPLNGLPFDALLTNTAKQSDFRTLPYLLLSTAVSYGYSGVLFSEKSKKKIIVNNGRCLAFAPSYEEEKSKPIAARGSLETVRGESFISLPGTQKEVKSLADYVKGDYLFGSEATEELFKEKASGYSILHLAMHGESASDHPMNSRLVFTIDKKDTAEDGSLYAYELYNMKLNADLAVLSACQTGTGKYYRGEGVMSLARAFMYAGVSSVLLTYWDASDGPSAELTNYFYKHLTEGSPKAESLRQAKIDYLTQSGDRFVHPYYWSGYVLAGDEGPLERPKRVRFLITLLVIASVILLFSLFLYRKKKQYWHNF